MGKFDLYRIGEKKWNDLDVDSTLFERYGRQMDVKITLYGKVVLKNKSDQCLSLTFLLLYQHIK